MTVAEIRKNTSVPSTIATRLCKKLTEGKLLRMVESDGRSARYALHRNAMKKTMLDVICVVEGCSGLFAAFDHSTELYQICKDCFEETDRLLTGSLRELTLGELKEKSKKY